MRNISFVKNQNKKLKITSKRFGRRDKVPYICKTRKKQYY